jgi:regulator of sigma E protease
MSIAGRATPTFDDVSNTVALRPNESVSVVLLRGDQRRVVDVKLGTAPVKDGNRTFERGLLGVAPKVGVHEPMSPLKAVPMAVQYTGRLTATIVDGLAQLVRGKMSAEQLGGPLKIAEVAGQGASQGLLPFIALVAMISINLGFINLLPVPMLDGGHLLFYAIEAVRRRPVSPQTLDWAFRGGMAALLALLLFTTFNDLGSFGLWDRLGSLIG